MSNASTVRLAKEYRQILKNPVDNIRTAPLPSNILEWHYVIEGPKNTPFAGGWYHGIIIFPPNYPYKPPSIQMITPNGRFKVKYKYTCSTFYLYTLITVLFHFPSASHTSMLVDVRFSSRIMESHLVHRQDTAGPI